MWEVENGVWVYSTLGNNGNTSVWAEVGDRGLAATANTISSPIFPRE